MFIHTQTADKPKTQTHIHTHRDTQRHTHARARAQTRTHADTRSGSTRTSSHSPPKILPRIATDPANAEQRENPEAQQRQRVARASSGHQTAGAQLKVGWPQEHELGLKLPLQRRACSTLWRPCDLDIRPSARSVGLICGLCRLLSHTQHSVTCKHTKCKHGGSSGRWDE